MSAPIIPGMERILFTEEQIDRRIREVAAEISRDYQGKAVKLVGVLKGSIFFLTALARHIEVPVKIDFLSISSFSNKSGAPGVVRIAKDLDEGIEGEEVLLVEDIVDTGFTLRYLLQTLAGRAPNSLYVCTFLSYTIGDDRGKDKRAESCFQSGDQSFERSRAGYGLRVLGVPAKLRQI